MGLSVLHFCSSIELRDGYHSCACLHERRASSYNRCGIEFVATLHELRRSGCQYARDVHTDANTQCSTNHVCASVDSTQAYGGGEAESIMGEVLKDGFNDGFWRREDLVISTKIFWGRPIQSVNDVGLSRKHVIEGTLASLKRLQLDYADIMFAYCLVRWTLLFALPMFVCRMHALRFQLSVLPVRVCKMHVLHMLLSVLPMLICMCCRH